jgi:hypothetical protein
MPDEEVIELALDSFKKLKDWRTIVMWKRAFDILYNRQELKINNPELVVDITTKALKSQVRNRLEKKEVEAILADEDKLENLCRQMALALYFNNQLN